MAELLKSEMRGLDPCPFCGGTATQCKDRQRYWVECIDGCRAKTAVYKSADDAAQAWNQRNEARWHSVDEPGQPPVDQELLVCASGKPRENITLRNAIELATCDPSDPGFWILSEWPDWQGVCRRCEVPKTEVRGYGHWLMLN